MTGDTGNSHTDKKGRSVYSLWVIVILNEINRTEHKVTVDVMVHERRGAVTVFVRGRIVVIKESETISNLCIVKSINIAV